MKTVLVAVLALFCVITSVRAQDTCKVQADGKNLHGAALTSFAKKLPHASSRCSKASRAAEDELH